MRHTIQTISFILLAGTMLGGCDYEFQPYKFTKVAIDKEPEPEKKEQYVDLERGVLNDDNTIKGETAASDIAARLSEKYGKAVDELKEMQNKHMALVEKDKASQIQISKLTTDIAQAEKELSESNTLLLEMREELAKWKKDVLSFRGEMRKSQEAIINGLTRLHVLVSGGVATDTTVTKPAPIATNTEEKNGEKLQ
jgi:hypothetical protein